MKNNSKIISKWTLNSSIIWLVLIGYLLAIPGALAQETQVVDAQQYKGVVSDSKTKKKLEYASISVNDSNISTVTNSEGEFILKVPKDLLNRSITISYLGYRNKVIPLTQLKPEKNSIKLDEYIENLPEVNVISKDPESLIREVMKNAKENYHSDPLIMDAFYRETIKKGKKYASLSEAVVEVYKHPYRSSSNDYVKLIKARKSTDYKRIDTLLIKLQGGPYNTLNFDIVRNRKVLFNEDLFTNYKFKFDKVVNIDDKTMYVISFKQREDIYDPLFYGKLYIDASSSALSKAEISLNLEDEEKASSYFVKKKPSRAKVTPVVANYQVDYSESQGKWYYSYSRIELAFKVNWKKKLFNSTYHIAIEMAVTDWDKNADGVSLKNKEKLKSNVILNDKASGFSDPEFWGDYNVIEPEKSIENAIKKIKRQLDK